MLLSYPYKFRHSNQQLEKFSGWLDMLAATYKWCLREIIESGHQEFIQVDYLKTRVGITRLTGSLVGGAKLDNPWKTGEDQSKAQLKVTALHNKIQQKCEAYQWWVANKLIKKYDAVAAEELPIENMRKRCQPIKSNTGRCLPNNQSAKRGLNRSLSDASWYDLTKKLEYLAAKSGKRLDKVNLQYTSQTCSKCSHVARYSRNGEKFICTNCGHIDDANRQAARNVKTKAIEAYGLTIVKKIRSKMVRVDCSKPVQLNLFEIELCECLPDNTLPQKGSVACGREPRWHSIVSLGC